MSLGPVPAVVAPPSPQPSLTQAEALWDRFLRSYREGNTRRAYERDLHRWYTYCDTNGVDPMHVTRLHVEDWVREVETTPTLNRSGNPTDELPKPATVHRMVNTVRTLYRYAVEHQILIENPVPTSKTLNLARLRTTSPTQSLTQAEAIRFLDAARARSPRDAAMVATLLYQGVRVGGLCDLDVEDLSTRHTGRTITIRLKGGDVQEQLLAETSGELIDAWLATRTAPLAGAELVHRSPGIAAGRTPLFTDSKGARIKYWHAEALVRACAQAIKLEKKLSPHSLRHTCITEALGLGVPLVDVQTMAGHRNAQTTVGYDRARTALDRSPVHKLNGRFG